MKDLYVNDEVEVEIVDKERTCGDYNKFIVYVNYR